MMLQVWNSPYGAGPASGVGAKKDAVQARSAVTVEAIAEATVQVLLVHGTERLTTTRVAERAGVSGRHAVSVFPE